VELGDPAAEVVLAVRVRADDLDLAHRQRRPASADGAESTSAGLGLLEQVEVDLDVVDLLHATDVGVSPRLVRVDERTRHPETRAGVHDLLAVDVAVAAGDLVLDSERELDPGAGVFHAPDCVHPVAPGARLDKTAVFRQWRQGWVSTRRR